MLTKHSVVVSIDEVLEALASQNSRSIDEDSLRVNVLDR